MRDVYSRSKTGILGVKKASAMEYYEVNQMKIDTPYNPELEKIHEAFTMLLGKPYRSIIVSAVDGTRKSNSKYRCAVYQSDRVSLVEKSATKVTHSEFDFSTKEFNSTLSDLAPFETFTQTLSDLIQKIQKGKATLLKKL